MVLSAEPVPITVRLTEADGRIHDSREPYPSSVEAATVAAIAPPGSLSCRAIGDASVVVHVGALTRSATVRCRLFDHFSISTGFARRLRADLDKAPYVPPVFVAGSGGVILDDVPVSFASKTSDVLAFDGGLLLPRKVGQATLVASVGPFAREYPVDVVRKVDSPWRVRSGGRRSTELEAGSYEFDVWFADEKRLTVEWQEASGASGCKYSAVNAHHVTSCSLATRGEIVVSPADFQGTLLEVPVLDEP